MTDPADRVGDLTFKARALAQAHPLTVTATSYREQMIEEERRTQPMSEFADWAVLSTSLCCSTEARRVSSVSHGPSGITIGGQNVSRSGAVPPNFCSSWQGLNYRMSCLHFMLFTMVSFLLTAASKKGEARA